MPASRSRSQPSRAPRRTCPTARCWRMASIAENSRSGQDDATRPPRRCVPTAAFPPTPSPWGHRRGRSRSPERTQGTRWSSPFSKRPPLPGSRSPTRPRACTGWRPTASDLGLDSVDLGSQSKAGEDERVPTFAKMRMHDATVNDESVGSVSPTQVDNVWPEFAGGDQGGKAEDERLRVEILARLRPGVLTEAESPSRTQRSATRAPGHIVGDQAMVTAESR